ncbi:hypothetical protein [Natrinema sp. 1APR25-10V2]|uniref:hypothetical protein n=1 Tax=Natrinema sp. 1APR25-10V2 TaxID=2951081 RepID=UPI002876E4BE|nr:hypothetical protein [Natrinema sp. 1APR25-10V2]MDS0476362.1 hypothetical protein [Natrinema sp. 1APR25-10V2]
MGKTRADRADRWSENIDQLCADGETIERRVGLEGATVAVTTRRVLVFTPSASGRNFREVERPNVGTVTVETAQRLSQLCWALVAAVVGITLVETARSVDFSGFAPDADFESAASLPGVDAVTNAVNGVFSAIETALLLVDWGILAGGVAAFVLAVAFVARYVRSRSRRLRIRVNGGSDIELSAAGVDRGADVAADLEAAIRPGSALGVDSDAVESGGGGGERPTSERSNDERARTDRPGSEWLGDEESG